MRILTQIIHFSLLALTFSGILVSKFGSKKMLVVSEVFYALALLSIGFSHTVFHLILSLVAFGMMANLMNIATNTQACVPPRDSHRLALSRR